MSDILQLTGTLSPRHALPQRPGARRIETFSDAEVSLGRCSARGFAPMSDEEQSLLDIYRDFRSYYEELDARHKFYFQVWLHTADMRLLPHVFPGLFDEQFVDALHITTAKGSNQFALVIG